MFTSATIITSAILFRGFHGTWTSITTVIMGFLFICSGVVLLQLAKSSKDVPDTAIFQGDLDQVRTMAEQEEPESEPRADTIRGGAAIIRAISKKRTERQIDELKTIHSDHMASINEDEPFYYDGLRRRKTVLAPGQSGIRRQKTVHPPLGMSHFPDDTDMHSDAGSTETDVHPGFHFSKFMGRRRSSAAKTRSSSNATHQEPITELKDLEAGNKTQSRFEISDRDQTAHVFGLPPGLQPLHSNDGASDFDQDTSYKSPHVNFASPLPTHDRPGSQSSSLFPPKPPPHTSSSGSGSAKRTFSFQNPVSRLFKHHNTTHDALPLEDQDDMDDAASDRRPLSRSAFSYTAGASRTGSYDRPTTGSSSHQHRPHTVQETEEERLGLVKGDSNTNSPATSRHSPQGGYGGAISEEDDDWLVASGRSESPEDLAGDLGRFGVRSAHSGRARFDESSEDEVDVEGLSFVKPRRQSGL